MTTLIPFRQRKEPTALSVDVVLRYLLHENLDLPHDYLVRTVTLLAQSLMEIDVSKQIAAERYERRGSRLTYRNGYRKRIWQTKIGAVLLEIPKLRSSTYFPEFLNSPDFADTCLEFALRHYAQEAAFEDVEEFLLSLHVDAEPHEIAQLQEALYDLREECLTLTEIERVVLDWLPYRKDGERRYLAVALEEGQLLAWESTPYLHDAFWCQFIRRIEAITPPATAITSRHTLPTLQLSPPTSSPQMALAA